MKWTKENCFNEALKYANRRQFQDMSVSAYCAAWKRGWLDDICSHMIKPKRIIYTKDICRAKALEYKFRREFIKYAERFYRVCLRNDWIDELCSHMELSTSKYRRCIYAYEFSDNHVYVGLTYDIDDRNRFHLIKGPVKDHMDNTGLTPVLKKLTKYIPVEQAKLKEGYWQRKYKREGWIPLYKSNRSGSIGMCGINYTLDICKKEAIKYNNRTDFRLFAQKYYNASIRNGWLNEICGHMQRPINNNIPIVSIKDNCEIYFNSQIEAGRELNIDPSYINKVLKGKRSHTNGYKFRYA